MPITRSRRIASRIALLVSSAVLFVLAAWVGFRLFTPTDIPPSMPPQSLVSFNADKTIEKHPVFEKLQVFVRSEYLVGAVGNAFPLGGNPKKKTPKGYDNKALLATAAEVQLNGILVKDISLKKDGGILALLHNITSDGQVHYEIRLMGLKEDVFVAQWNALPRLDLRVAGIASDSSGKIWLLNEKGQIGMIGQDGNASWKTNLQTGLVALDPQKLSISIDALDRVWVTDGVAISMGGEKGFTPVDLNAELTEEQRVQYSGVLASQAGSIGLQSLNGSDSLLRAALVPKSFYPLPDGRMGLTTAFGAFVFPPSQSARAEWVPTVQFSQIPYGISQNGETWGVRYTDQVFSRVIRGEEKLFSAGPSPSSEQLKSSSMAFVEEGAYVFEVSDKLTNLWFSDGETWSTKLVASTGTQSVLAAPSKISVEDSGVLWSLMTDGRLYKITAGATVEASNDMTNL